MVIGDWGLGIGDWGLGIGDWGQYPISNYLSSTPNSHRYKKFYFNYFTFYIFFFYFRW